MKSKSDREKFDDKVFAEMEEGELLNRQRFGKEFLSFAKNVGFSAWTIQDLRERQRMSPLDIAALILEKGKAQGKEFKPESD